MNFNILKPRPGFGNVAGGPCSVAKQDAGLPGINCFGVPGCCRRIWSTIANRIRCELPANHFLYQRKRAPVFPEEMEQLKEAVRTSLPIEKEALLLPGTRIGYVSLFCNQENVPPFSWPETSTLVVTEEAVRFLTDSGFTGWELAPVTIAPGSAIPSQRLYELGITGKAGKAITNPPTYLEFHCSVCGRTEYNNHPVIASSVDPDQWDGSDFFRFDVPHHGYVIVTEDVRVALDNAISLGIMASPLFQP